MRYSIITINYNNRDGLRKTIESVVGQTSRDFEYIVIDGGSTDGSKEVITEYADKIDYWVSEPDSGIYNAMNKGVGHARGEYLNFMNSGDCFHDENVLAALPGDADEDIIFGCAVTSAGGLWAPAKVMTLYSLCLHLFNHQSTFYKRSIFDSDMYDESLKLLSDWKLTVKSIVADNRTYRVVDNIIALYDLNGISSADAEARYREQETIMRELFPERIVDDYLFFRRLRSPLLDDIAYLSSRYRLHRIIIKIVRFAIRMNKKIFDR